jgi:truncated hemoglobin YjbI/ankyrin repeat protein
VPGMEGRRFLAQGQVHHCLAGRDLFTRIGGRAAIDSLVDGLYERIEGDASLRPLFGRDLTNERAAQKRFFTEWLGGEAEYSGQAHLPLMHRHDLLPITRRLAGRWLAHFRHALEDAVSDQLARAYIFETVTTLAMAFVNDGEPPSALRARSHGSCLRYKPAVESLGLARRGDAPALRALLQRAPDVLASAPHAATLMQFAALSGRDSVIELLLDSGVDVDKPAPIDELILITALCAARWKRRRRTEALLLERGASEDIFTHAFLGDLPRLRDDLDADPSSAQVFDPAVDVLQVTPVHHAVVGGQVEAMQALLSGAARDASGPLAVVAGERALRQAVARQNVEMVAVLLEHRVRGTSIGAGRWVLHPELASMLSRAGAQVDRSGAWIGLSCTGNQGRRDDPEYVVALLRHGARVDDRRLAGQANDGGRATALHYAARAGFTNTITVLLEHGADPIARDDNGLTPIDWVERAAKSVDREKVRRLLGRGAPLRRQPACAT